MNELLKYVESEDAERRATHPKFSAGDTINVHVKIKRETKSVSSSFKELFYKERTLIQTEKLLQ